LRRVGKLVWMLLAGEGARRRQRVRVCLYGRKHFCAGPARLERP